MFLSISRAISYYSQPIQIEFLHPNQSRIGNPRNLQRRAEFKIRDLDFGFDIVDGVAAFNLQGYGFAGQGFHEDLHLFFFFSFCDQ